MWTGRARESGMWLVSADVTGKRGSTHGATRPNRGGRTGAENLPARRILCADGREELTELAPGPG